MTGAADSFDANSDSLNIYAIVVQADGKILVCGQFSNIGGQPRNSIARLDPVTGLADSFNPNTNINQLGGVYTMAVQSDGKVVVGGTLTLVGGQTRNYIARCDAVTGAADSFDPNANFFVYAVAIQPDGKILVGRWVQRSEQHRRSEPQRLRSFE